MVPSRGVREFASTQMGSGCSSPELPHMRESRLLSEDPVWCETLQGVVDCVFRYADVGGYVEDDVMTTAMTDLIRATTEHADRHLMPHQGQTTLLQAPHAQALALLFKQISHCPHRAAWMFMTCATDLTDLPLEHVLDRVRDLTEAVAVAVVPTFLVPRWFARDIAPTESLTDLFIFTLACIPFWYYPYRVRNVRNGICFHNGTRYDQMQLLSQYRAIPQSILDMGMQATYAYVHLGITNDDVADGILKCLLQAPPVGDNERCAEAARCIHIEVRALRGALTEGLYMPMPAFSRLLQGVRATEMFMVCNLNRATCHLSSLPKVSPDMDCWSKAIEDGVEGQRRACADRAFTFRLSLMMVKHPSPEEIDPHLFVTKCIMSQDPCLNELFAPGVRFPAMREMDAINIDMDDVLEVHVRVRDGPEHVLGDVNADDFIGKTKEYVLAIAKFLLKHRPGIITEDDVRILTGSSAHELLNAKKSACNAYKRRRVS